MKEYTDDIKSYTVAYLEPSQTSKIQRFAKAVTAKLFSQKAPSSMFDNVPNIYLLYFCLTYTVLRKSFIGLGNFFRHSKKLMKLTEISGQYFCNLIHFRPMFSFCTP